MGGFALAASAGWNLANIGAVAGRTSAAYGVGLAVVGLFTTALVLTHAAMQIPAGRLCDRFGARLVGAAALVLTHAAMQIPAGRLCDRFGARLVGAAGLVLIGISSLAGLAWREAWFAIGIRLVTGIGLAAAFVGGADY